jgi:glycine cleavage system H protein
MSEGPAFLAFKRSKFKTRLPVELLYTPGHMWLRNAQEDLWQVGLTRFALRMLGDPVEADFETPVGQALEAGEIVGWLEGFKAVSDLYSPMNGAFAGGNPALEDDIECVSSSTYQRGWLFSLRGTPGESCVDAEGYASFLDASINKMLGDEKS